MAARLQNQPDRRDASAETIQQQGNVPNLAPLSVGNVEPLSDVKWHIRPEHDCRPDEQDEQRGRDAQRHFEVTQAETHQQRQQQVH